MTVTAPDPTRVAEELPGPPADAATDAVATGAGPLVEEDLLVEDVSIDGMCGVY
jgi:mycofactocin precursor